MNKILRRMTLMIVLLIAFGTMVSAYANNAVPKKKDDEQKKEVVELDPNHSQAPSSEEAKNEIKKEDQSEYEKEIIQVPIEAPASVTGEKYQGSGTVIDFTSTGSKAFYTIQAKDRSIFYLIIDLDKTENNVYFLSEINGEELSLKEVTTSNRPQGISTQIFPQQMTSSPPSEQKSGAIFYIFVLMGSAGFVCWYYLKKIKPKQYMKKTTTNEDEELYFDEDFYDEEYEEFDSDDEE